MNNYKLIDSGDKKRLEQFGKYVINRPDPEAMWSPSLPESKWKNADATYQNGKWQTKSGFPKSWTVEYKELVLNLKLTPFKHLGIFPEQEFEWDLISKMTENSTNRNVLNLFGYTGVASLIALKSGAKVTHVDASKPTMTWFRENQASSKLLDRPCRLIIDDCLKFTEREIKRGVKYDGIIMDPPAYGHGPDGKAWNFSKDFQNLLHNVTRLLSTDPLFLIVNAYAVSTSHTTIRNMVNTKMSSYKGQTESGELSLVEESSGKILTTGIYTTWKKTA